VTAPSDPRLPPGGGFEICGLYDIKPEKFGQVETHLVPARRFGKQSQVYNGIEAKMNLRRGGHLLSGGLITGAEVRDRCYVVDSPQELRYCHVAPPWSAGTQFKLHGITLLPRDLQLSGALQVLPSIPAQANRRFTNAEVRPSLGRTLSGVTNVNIAMLEPEQIYLEGWSAQVDLRLARLPMGSRDAARPDDRPVQPVQRQSGARHEQYVRADVSECHQRPRPARRETRRAARFLIARPHPPASRAHVAAHLRASVRI
jgi:hypothetical protein